jgi:hypothetical protein
MPVAAEKIDDEVIVSKEIADAGTLFTELRAAAERGQANARLQLTGLEYWRTVVMPHIGTPISPQGFTAVIRDAIAAGKACLPPTMGAPQDAVIEVFFICLLNRLRTAARGQ